MKGLLLEIYYKNIKNICIMNSILLGIWILINLFFKSQTIIFVFFAVFVLSNSLLLLLSQRKDYDLKLYKYEFLLPLKKSHLVLSKYISQFFIISISTLVLMGLISISVHLGKNYFDYGWTDGIMLMNMLLAFNFQMVSIFYLCLFFIDLEKGDLWILLGIIGSIIILFMEVFILNSLGFTKIVGNYVLAGMYFLIFIVSLLLCLKKIESFKIK